MKIIATVGKHMYWLMTKKDLPKRAVVFTWLVNFLIASCAFYLICKAVSLVIE